jgi:hypothetical protein
MLRDRCAQLEGELATLREEAERLDADLEARFILLWPTRDPDLRQCRAHSSLDLWFIAGGLGVGAIVARTRAARSALQVDRGLGTGARGRLANVRTSRLPTSSHKARSW